MINLSDLNTTQNVKQFQTVTINKHVPFRFYSRFINVDTVLLVTITIGLYKIRETETAGGIVSNHID